MTSRPEQTVTARCRTTVTTARASTGGGTGMVGSTTNIEVV